jgi:DNA-binding transcriptional ArsR family regulator
MQISSSSSNHLIISSSIDLPRQMIALPDNAILAILKFLPETKDANSFKITCKYLKKTAGELYYKNFCRNQLDYLQTSCFDIYAKVFLNFKTMGYMPTLNKALYSQTKGEICSIKIHLAKALENAIILSQSLEETKKIVILAEASNILAYHDLYEAIQWANSIQDINWKPYALSLIAQAIAEENPDQALKIAMFCQDFAVSL